MTDSPLVALSLRAFVARVADADHPVPAAGSVAALTASAAAALLALVCGVIRRHRPDVLGSELQRAEHLQQELLELVDEDAAAFHSFLHARRHGVDLSQATQRISQVPLRIAQLCGEILQLAETVEPHTGGPMLGDVRAARSLADASRQTALELARQNVDY